MMDRICLYSVMTMKSKLLLLGRCLMALMFSLMSIFPSLYWLGAEKYFRFSMLIPETNPNRLWLNTKLYACISSSEQLYICISTKYCGQADASNAVTFKLTPIRYLNQLNAKQIQIESQPIHFRSVLRNALIAWARSARPLVTAPVPWLIDYAEQVVFVVRTSALVVIKPAAPVFVGIGATLEVGGVRLILWGLLRILIASVGVLSSLNVGVRYWRVLITLIVIITVSIVINDFRGCLSVCHQLRQYLLNLFGRIISNGQVGELSMDVHFKGTSNKGSSSNNSLFAILVTFSKQVKYIDSVMNYNEFASLGVFPQLHLVFEGVNECGSIYISNYFSAMNSSLLERNNIRAVLTIAKGYFLPHSKEDMPNYMYIPIEDRSSVDISQYFEKCISFIDKSRAKTNILIHCRAGVSRSATIIIAYLMKRFNLSLNSAYQIVKKANPNIKPNSGFQKQLEDFSLQLFGERQILTIKPESARNSAAKWPQNDELETEKRKSSLCKMAQNLRFENKKIESHIGKIKKMVEEGEVRTRSKSEFLRRKMEEFQSKKEQITETINLSMKSKLSYNI